jgi:hypothetical protein
MNFLGQVFTPWKKGGWASGGGGGSVPSYNPQNAFDLGQKQFNQMSGNALGFGSNLFQSAANNALAYAPAFTQSNIDLQNKVTPGSSAQREAALQQINSYIQGQVPQDVQQNTQRAIAQSFGGGYNPFTGGGQAPSAFARNIGQTSVGLSQYGLSAAPTWQQLANSMVTKPESLMGFGIQSGQIGAGLASSAASLGNDMGQSQYNSQMNQYLTQQAQQQQNQQLAMQLGSLALGGYGALGNASYLSALAPSMQGKLATFGGLPATQGLDALASSYGTPVGGGVGRPRTASFNAAMSAGGWD